MFQLLTYRADLVKRTLGMAFTLLLEVGVEKQDKSVKIMRINEEIMKISNYLEELEGQSLIDRGQKSWHGPA